MHDSNLLSSRARYEHGSLPKRRSAFQIVLVGLIVGMAVYLAGCGSSVEMGQATEDRTYLTAVPEATLMAFRSDSPIRNKLQAVIAARVNLESTRLRFSEPPQVVSVDALSLEEAHQRVAQPRITTYEDRPGDTPVWLVIFEGDWQVFPPDPFHTVTPPPPVHGCTYVIIDQNDGARTEICEISCPP